MSSIIRFVLVACFMLSSLYANTKSIDYWSNRSYEGEASFDFYVKLNSDEAEKIHKAIAFQMKALIYPMDGMGISQRGDYQVTINEVKKTGTLYTAKYSMKVTFQIPLTRSADVVEFDMIHNPADIIKKVARAKDCTQYQGDDFWVYWNPREKVCKLDEGSDFTKLQVEVKRNANTEVSYPEYANMLRPSGEVVIALFIGNDAYHTIEELEKSLSGFERHNWTEEEIYTIAPKGVSALPEVVTFKKTLESTTVVVRVFKGITGGSDDDQKAFRYFYKDAIENASFVGYSGHAGLGMNLNFASMEGLEDFTIVPSSQYQIYLVNACFPYQYYTRQFFDRKKTETDVRGTKALDLVTSESQLWSGMELTIKFVKAVHDFYETGARTSYQDLLRDHQPSHSVDGDQDNAL